MAAQETPRKGGSGGAHVDTPPRSGFRSPTCPSHWPNLPGRMVQGSLGNTVTCVQVRAGERGARVINLMEVRPGHPFKFSHDTQKKKKKNEKHLMALQALPSPNPSNLILALA